MFDNTNFDLWVIWFRNDVLYFWVLEFLTSNGIGNYPELEEYRKELSYNLGYVRYGVDKVLIDFCKDLSNKSKIYDDN